MWIIKIDCLMRTDFLMRTGTLPPGA